MTKLNHRREKLGRLRQRKTEWKHRPSAAVRKDLQIISDAWEGTAEDRRAWGILKRELQASELEEQRIAAKAK